MPTISIVIPCYNRQDFIGEALESALHQAHADLEVVVVDDGSTDASAAVVETFHHVTLIRQENAGVSVARNNGLKVSRGELVVFLDSDDRLAADALSAVAPLFAQDRALAMAFGGNRIIDRSGALIGANLQPMRYFDYWDVLEGMTPSPSQCMFRRSALELAGAFNPSIALSEDWDLYLRLARIGKILCHGQVVADYRTHPGQTRAPARALRSALDILDAQAGTAVSPWEAARFRAARKHRKAYYGQFLMIELIRNLLERDPEKCLLSMRAIALALPYSVSGAFLYLWRRQAKRASRTLSRPDTA